MFLRLIVNKISKMFKKSLLLLSFIMVFSLSLNAATISKDECAKKEENLCSAKKLKFKEE